MGKHLMDMYGLGLLSIDTDGIEFIICLLFVLSGFIVTFTLEQFAGLR